MRAICATLVAINILFWGYNMLLKNQFIQPITVFEHTKHIPAVDVFTPTHALK